MPQGTIQSVDRVFEIIEVLAKSQKPMALSEISEAVQLHKTTVHRMLFSLISRGYAMHNEETAKYNLTMKLLEIGSQASNGCNIVNISAPYLTDLAEITNEVVHLVVRDDTEIVYLFKQDSSNYTVRMSSHVGLRNPLYCTALGKSIMAFLSDEEMHDVWNKSKIEQFTPMTRTSFSALYQDLVVAKIKGYAIDDEEHEPGIRCIGVPIFNYKNEPIGAISVSAPSNRLSYNEFDKIAPAVLKTAKQISAMLGKTPSHTS